MGLIMKYYSFSIVFQGLWLKKIKVKSLQGLLFKGLKVDSESSVSVCLCGVFIRAEVFTLSLGVC